MSCQKGNANRSRPQKYQNSHGFKNNLYDTSHKTKAINNIPVVNVCDRCKKIIEWKIKYKKYKPLKAPSKCTKCEQKCVKHAYHIMCESCADKCQVCSKCGEKKEIIKPEIKIEPVKLDRELRLMLKKLPERKKRTFLRYMNRKTKNGETSKVTLNNDGQEQLETSNVDEDKAVKEEIPLSRDDLLAKLQSLMVTSKKKKDDNDVDDDFDDFASDSDEEDISFNSSDSDNDADDSNSDDTNDRLKKR